MDKSRMEAFSDGVLAIIITIMVLNLMPPRATDASALRPLVPNLLSYVLSFVYVGIYWANHHHLLQAADHVSGGILWANLHLLFWLSLTPFASAWLGSSALAPLPVALYGIVLLFAAIAYYILTRALIARHGPESQLAASIGRDSKGRASVALYCIAIALAFLAPAASCACYVAVAVMWLIPDPRIENRLKR